MKRFLGTKEFYLRILSVAIPIMIQNGITNFVNLLDNIMIGRIGTDQMSGVAIVNELLFVFNLCVFGGVSGIGILTAQLYGKGDTKGVRYTMRLQLMFSLVIAAAGFLVLYFFGGRLIPLYLTEDTGAGDITATFNYATGYLKLMFIGIVPFAITQAYAASLRACSETKLPMASSLIAVAVNLVGNYVLIFGKAGFPALGVTGAAIATVVSRFVELIFIVSRTHALSGKYPFVKGLYRSLHVPLDLAKRSFAKGLPLLLNEALWAGGMATLTQSYSMRGLSVIAAMNIMLTINNVANMSFIAMGNAIGILLGQQLGANRLKQAKEDATKAAVFTAFICVVTGVALFFVSVIFPRFYNTTDDIRNLATSLIRICSVCFPLYGISASAYFTLRAGGSTFITFLFDAVFVWTFQISTAATLVRVTTWNVLIIFFIVETLNLVKCIVGTILVQRGVWVRNIAVYEE